MTSEKMKLIALRALNRAQPTLTVGPQEEERVGAAIRAASLHVEVDQVPIAGSMRAVKRMVLRASRLFLTRQASFNREALNATSELNHVVHLLGSELLGVRSELDQLRRTHTAERALIGLRLDDAEARIAGLVAELEGVGPQIDARTRVLSSELTALINEIRTTVDAVHASVGELDEQAEHDRVNSTTVQRQLEVLIRLVRDDVSRLVADVRRSGQAPAAETLAMVEAQGDAMFETTYERFEEVFRGANTEIEKRLEVYLPDVEGFADGSAPILDLGSGRGEWLQLLRRMKVPAYGVDISERFVASAVADGLDVRESDALTALAACDAGSLAGVTAFQLVEHMEPTVVRRLLDLAYAAVAPGGVVILETPNPTNLRVGAGSFYRDPTHLRPVHPDLLSFLVSESGFVGVETRFLNPMAEFGDPLDSEGTLGAAARQHLRDLRWALYGPQDYAVVARKPATPST